MPTAEVLQLAGEGVEQLETYFGAYLPQFFYAMLAPLTLFIALAPVSVKAAVILMICVPLIPVSIVAVQKFAKNCWANTGASTPRWVTAFWKTFRG